ncbi:MAG: IscS subfamily cysteine desulfurase [Legionella sp.]|nr:IscS subfamily cysteine desulfurase [Legionella sp.]
MSEQTSLKPMYFDYMATTPIDPEVIDEMLKYMGPDAHFGNPASNTHAYGATAAKAVALARRQIADSIHADSEEIVFTSGATEADNLALLGAARFYQNKGKHLITMSTEHKAVLDSFHQLEKEGFEVTYLKPQADGLLDLSQLKQNIKKETILVSIMQVNNEIGVIQDIAAISERLQNQGILFHVDAAQSAGKIAIDLSKIHVDLMSFSAHKNYGPKGVGALYVRRKPRIRLQPQTFGGGHEGGLRSGTLATHQIVGMGAAFELSERLREQEQLRILSFRKALWNGIKHLPGLSLNGHEDLRIAGNLNLTFAGIKGEDLLMALSAMAVSRASACSSASIQPSYVLSALGLTDELAYSSLRLSMGRFTQQKQIDDAISIICTQVQRLHAL